MIDNYYRLYRNEIFSLARSLVIKYDDIGISINNGLENQGHIIDTNDRRKWKYYLNLSGEYHETDQMIRVRSIDTLETIDFTKESLKTHRATRREYLPGGRFHQRILSDYPEQTTLIRGILNPIDIDVAIAANDGDLLSWDDSLVESNEYYLIQDIQKWIWGYTSRWYNQQYNILDDLYLPLFLGQMYLHIVPAIERMRTARCHTREAHSFHIRQYLASNGGLDRYINYLTKEQTLWLYRNIRYIRQHMGKNSTFHMLIENILTKRNIPLQGYYLNHDYTPLNESLELYPDVYMIKDPINVDYIQSGINKETVNTILNRQVGQARDNRLLLPEAEEYTLHSGSRSNKSQHPTKVLESEIVDRTNSSVRSLNNVLIHEWIHLAYSGRYTGYVTFTHPSSGELLTVSTKDALIIALYCTLKLNNQDVEGIPNMHAYNVLRIPLPTRSELLSKVDPYYVPSGMVEAIQDRITPLGSFVTPDEFYDACFRLHKEYLALWSLYSFQEHYMVRGYTEQMVKLHFMDVNCHLTDTPMLFKDWISEKGFQLENLASVDYGRIFTECVSRATGTNIRDRRSLAEIQKMLLELMGELSSYGVHYIQNINNSDFFYIGDPAVRVGDYSAKTFPHFKVPIPIVAIKEMTSKRRETLTLWDETIDPPITIRAKTKRHYRIGVDIGVRLRTHQLGRVHVDVNDVKTRLRQSNND